MDYHQLLRDSLTRLPTVAATIDSIRKAVQDRGELVILYFNFDRYSKVEEVYGWEKLDSVLETTGAAMRDFLSKSPLASSKLMVSFPNDDDFIFFHVPQDDAPAATDAEITDLPMYLRARNGISYLPQEPSVWTRRGTPRSPRRASAGAG